MNQRTKPCHDCPFARHCPPGELGGGKLTTYVGQIVQGFWLPCHCSKNYAGKATVASEVEQCAGAAMFRANLGLSNYMPHGILSLPRDTDLSFSTLADFWSHHARISRTAALAQVTPHAVAEMARQELEDANVRMQLVPRKL